MRKLRVLISVYNVPGYMFPEIAALLPHAEVAVYQRPCHLTPKADSPWATKVRWIDREVVETADKLVVELGDWVPDVYLCGGWNDPAYVGAARYYRKRGCKTVLCMDTTWEGGLRQYVNCWTAWFRLKPAFDFVWGAGRPQADYARRLGFKEEQIRGGYYSADTDRFAALFKPDKQPYPHVFIYVGRYAEAKNMRRMERAFIRALERMPESDWKLRCIGRGPLWEERTQHPRIEHLGYKLPTEIQNYVADSGCFVLPSIFEPWGVVVHEFAVMGLPMLCSIRVNAASAYLKAGENGFTFNPFDEEEMTEAVLKVMRLDDKTLQKMGERSHALGMSYTDTDWAKTALSFAEKKD